MTIVQSKYACETDKDNNNNWKNNDNTLDQQNNDKLQLNYLKRRILTDYLEHNI